MDGRLYKEPALHPPTCTKMAEIARGIGLDLDDGELQDYRGNSFLALGVLSKILHLHLRNFLLRQLAF